MSSVGSRTRCNILWKPPKFGNKVKIGNKVKLETGLYGLSVLSLLQIFLKGLVLHRGQCLFTKIISHDMI